ncbi:MAG TPA: ParM/StbA family protein [Anaerolineaceae bacterium]|nr:ParM/StbA family protein [Anaerolineaceae bacterium]
MTDLLSFGLDLGMGACKLYGAAGGLFLQSQVAADNKQNISALLGLRNRKPPLRICFGEMSLFVGSHAHGFGRPIENLDFDRLAGSLETRAIVYATLTRYMEIYGEITAPVSLVVGLPLQPLTGAQSAQNAESARAWLKGSHEWLCDDKPFQISIAEVKIASQPSGALFDYLLDLQGQFVSDRKKDFSAEIGVLSLGFNTLELLTIQNRSAVQGLSAGTTAGVRRLLELLNPEGLYSLGELDTLLRAGSLDIKTALPIWWREVSGAIEKTWGGRWKRFARILAVGGGVHLLRDQLPTYFAGRAFIPDDPVLSISRGLYKLALMQSARKPQPEGEAAHGT